MLAVVFSRRWLTALAVAAIFAMACLFLGRWQWHRHEAKAERAELIERYYFATNPVPFSRVAPRSDSPLPPAKEWMLTTATGRYDDRHLMLVRNRPNNGVFGYHVVVPLELADGSSLLVDRGWIPNGRTAAEPPRTPATPVGQVTVTGWLRRGEASFDRRLPRGQLASINVDEARAQGVASLRDAYLARRSETGPPGARIEAAQPLERPDTGRGPHLAYAIQWWLAAPVGFVLVLVGARREHLEGRAPLPAPGFPAATPPLVKAKKTRIWDEEDE